MSGVWGAVWRTMASSGNLNLSITVEMSAEASPPDSQCSVGGPGGPGGLATPSQHLW